MDSQRSAEMQARMLRAWHLAILRFAVTRDNADRLSVFAIAREIDAIGRRDESPCFEFFRNTSSELCAALVSRDEAAKAILRQYLARIDDVRLGRVLGAALDIELPGRMEEKRRSKPPSSLWRALASRNNASH